MGMMSSSSASEGESHYEAVRPAANHDGGAMTASAMANQSAAASTATRELEDLMESLSEFKVSVSCGNGACSGLSVAKRKWTIDSMSPGGYLKMNSSCAFFCGISLEWMPIILKSTLGEVMAWCHQATSRYLNQCWPRSLSWYGITTRP